MAEPVKTSVSISKALFDQAEFLAQQLHVSPEQLLEMALDKFIRDDSTPHDAPPATPSRVGRVINQGDIYWLQVDDSSDLEAGIPHPHVVIQEDVLNHSRIHTVVACALTSNIKRASLPGNVVLEMGEANLPRASVVEASKVSTVDKTHLGEYIGTLSDERINQIVAGMRFLQKSFFAR